MVLRGIRVPTDSNHRTASVVPIPARSAALIMEALREATPPADGRALEEGSTVAGSTVADFMAAGFMAAGFTEGSTVASLAAMAASRSGWEAVIRPLGGDILTRTTTTATTTLTTIITSPAPHSTGTTAMIPPAITPM